MASYIELAAGRGARTGRMFGKAADAILGVEDAEAAVERVLMNGDWTTEEGKAKMLAEVGAIDPEAHGELQKQMLEAEQTKEATSNVKMNTENQLIAHKQKIFGSIYARDFERDASNVGEGVAIHYFLTKNDIKFNPKEVKTIAQAEAAIKKHMGKDSNYKNTQKQLNTYVLQQRDMYILRRATQDAGVELTSGSITATPNKFDTSLTDTSDTVDTSDDTGTQAVPENFNPLTTPEGPDFRAEKNGTMGTWTYVKDWIAGTGGMGGYEVKEWKFIPDIGAEYAKEGVKYNINGVSITNNEMFNNMLDDMAD